MKYEAVYFTELRQKETESFYEFCVCSIWHIFLCSGLFFWKYLDICYFLPELSKLTKRSEVYCCFQLSIEIKVEILAAYQLFENLFGCI